MKALLFILSGLFLTAYQTLAQTTETATHDATLLMQEYFRPFENANGTALSGGWINSGKTLEPFEFQILFSVQLVNIPEDDLTYRTDNLGLKQTVQLNDNFAPTFFGKSGDEFRPEYEYTDPQPGDITTFTGPEGIDLQEKWKNAIGINKALYPFPMVQARLGLPLSSSIMIRWLPRIPISSSTDVNLWGFGLTHSISDYFKKNNPQLIDMTFMLSYSKLRFTTDLITDEITVDNDIISEDGVGNQSTNVWNFQFVISKSWRSLTFYGGPGYFHSSTLNAILGDFRYRSGDELKEVSDPIRYETQFNGFRLTAGLNVEVSIFSFYGCFNFQKYNSLEIGMGLQF